MIFSRSRSSSTLEKPMRRTRRAPAMLDGLESRLLMSTVAATFQGQFATITASEVTATGFWQEPTAQDIADFVAQWNAYAANPFSATWIGDSSAGYVGDFYYTGSTENGWQGGDYPFAGPLTASKDSATAPWIVTLPSETSWDNCTFYGSFPDLSIAGDASGFGATQQTVHLTGDVIGPMFSVEMDVALTLSLNVQAPIQSVTLTDGASIENYQTNVNGGGTPATFHVAKSTDSGASSVYIAGISAPGVPARYEVRDAQNNLVSSGELSQGSAAGSGTHVALPTEGTTGAQDFTVNVGLVDGNGSFIPGTVLGALIEATDLNWTPAAVPAVKIERPNAGQPANSKEIEVVVRLGTDQWPSALTATITTMNGWAVPGLTVTGTGSMTGRETFTITVTADVPFNTFRLRVHGSAPEEYHDFVVEVIAP